MVSVVTSYTVVRSSVLIQDLICMGGLTILSSLTISLSLSVFNSFGYVVKGADFLSDIKEGDVITSAKVTQGAQNLKLP